MRTSTFKKVGIVLLIVIGLMISGCDTAKAIIPKPGQKDLVVNVFGKNGTSGNTIQVVGNETESVDGGYVYWYYDVPEEDYEYAAITMSPLVGDLRYMYLHLHASKKPPEKQ